MKPTIALFACAVCFAQSAAPAFEAASIHANTSTDRQDSQVLPGNLVLRNHPIFFLVEWAYDLPPAQIDGPSWLLESRCEGRWRRR